MTTGADRLARRFAAAGIRYAFGIPGGEVLALVDALERAGITFILTKHENAAGFMAEGVWHATGAPGLFIATLGPGVANAVNVVANALQDRVPLIFVTGCVDQALAESYTHQVFDHQALLRPVVKASLRAAAGTEDLVADKALVLALSRRPGPVHIDLPIVVAEASAPDTPIVISPRPSGGAPANLAEPLAMLARAERPLVIAGLDLVNEGGAAALDAFLTSTGAPLITTYKAKGLIDERDPRVIGAAGLSPKADKLIMPLVEAADLIVLAGYDPIEMRAGWRNPWGADKPVIDLVAEAMPHGMHSQTLLHEGPVAPVLEALARRHSAHPVWTGGEPARLKAALVKAFTPPAPWGPHVVFETLRAVAPPETVSSVDSGAHRILLSQMWTSYGPRRLIQSTGLCTMGCALPLAAGHALATGRPTICFVGDAGLDMVLGELSTLRDLTLPVVVVVLVDGELGLIELKQRQQQLARVGVSFSITDFSAVAQALGGAVVTVRDRPSLEAAARDAFARKGFTVIAAEIGARAYEGAF
ncbi:MAG: thiamine pyrophosphate-binding protein [Alphaproteobacteria bacterium]